MPYLTNNQKKTAFDLAREVEDPFLLRELELYLSMARAIGKGKADLSTASLYELCISKIRCNVNKFFKTPADALQQLPEKVVEDIYSEELLRKLLDESTRNAVLKRPELL